ncbi:MAG: UDP-N-acetylglucosamine 2-epimerase (non-hydrolyzing) [Acidaminococcaceae bacterium]|nr:UDP-N-acetylglucosamine 2-epimerase (non-hydrolyzing) [Acidaminococcaceae bacterium]
MKKILTVVGARPQFIKLAVVSRELRKYFDEVIVHTGQHYDYNMSEVFFEEMGISHPDYNLGISGGSHGEMTGRMLIELEQTFVKEQPDMVLLFGDTNSTMAAALAAVKLHIPVCHVEAGNRLGSLENPEEVNRIVTDHVSSLLLPCTQSGVEFLHKEGFEKNVYLVGDPMYDAFVYYSNHLKGNELDGMPSEFYYMTCHRQENTDTDEKLNQIFMAMEELDAKVIYPVHPRNKMRAHKLCEQFGYKNILLTDPVGYLTSVALVNQAKKIVTDSGGLQREAFFAKKPCVTVFDWVGWPETMVNNCNQLAKPNKMDILTKLNTDVKFDDNYQPFGDGHAAVKIVERVGEFLGNRL